MIPFSQNLSVHGKTIAPFRLIYTLSAIVVQKLCDFRFLLFLLNKRNLLYTNLTPSLFIKVSELSQEGSFICVLGISNLHISTIFLLNAGTVPTVCYIFFHFIIGYEKTPAELRLLKKNMVVIVFRN